MNKKNLFAEMSSTSTILFIVIPLLIIPSCKKITTNPHECRIATILDSASGINAGFNIIYNDNGKPSQISCYGTSDDWTKSIKYAGNLIVLTHTTSDGYFSYSDSVKLNKDNSIANIKIIHNPNGTDWDNIQIVYDNSGTPLKEIATSSGSSLITTTNYVVFDGDIISTSDGKNNYHYEYYSDRASQPGDLRWSESLFMYGVDNYMKSAHLLKSYSWMPNVIVNYSYDINENGQISRLVESSQGISASNTYKYDCN